jgi:hypothetical protein
MGKISSEAKQRYFERIKEYKNGIDEMQRKEKSIQSTLDEEDEGFGYKSITLADEVLNRVSYYILMNNLSVSLLGVKNEGFLNSARKDCYRSLKYLEDVITPYIDVPYSEFKEELEKIEDFGDEDRYRLVQKLGFAIHSVIDGFGENSKWKWSFVELEARHATITKNLINMKTIISGMDPRVEGYEIRIAHLDLAKTLLQQAADRYRQKYELATMRADDIKLAINYLSALRRLHVMVGESEQSETIKRKIDVWKEKMEDDSKRTEKKK